MRYELTETIEQLLGVDIPERNRNAQLLCMFHDEDTPSFSINLDNGMWQCFGCGMHGGLEKLAKLVGGELDPYEILIRSIDNEPKKPRRNFAPLANGYLRGAQTKRGQEFLHDYLGERGLPDSVAEHFGLGYDESRDRLAFPYWDGEVVNGIKLRARDGSKYSVDDSTYTLYNVEELRGKAIAIIGEGESDTQQLWIRTRDSVHQGSEVGWSGSQAHHRDRDESASQFGVGGTSGAVKSERLWQLFQLDLLFARKVLICYDADEAGDSAFKVAQRYLGDKAVRIRPPREGDDITKHFQRGGTLEELGLAEAIVHV